MPLRDLLSRELISCTPETPVKEVADLMKKHNVGAVLVLASGRPVGIVTDRDIVLRCIAEDNGSDVSVQQVMTEEVECVNIDDGLFTVMEKMKNNKVRRLPVIDDTGRAVGLVSFGDLIHLLSGELNGLAEFLTAEEPKLDVSAA